MAESGEKFEVLQLEEFKHRERKLNEVRYQLTISDMSQAFLRVNCTGRGRYN